MDHYPGKTLVYPDIQYRVRIYKMNGKAEANWSFAEVCRKGGYGTKNSISPDGAQDNLLKRKQKQISPSLRCAGRADTELK